jgi:cytochrome c oxidase accessory protein FixG
MDESFRDSIATIDEEGKRKRIYPKRVSGNFAKARQRVAYVLLAFLFVGPWIKIGGQPLFLLDVIGRKFVLLGQIFRPADTFIFVLLMISGVLSVIVFTVAFGRIFCGWVCPQTIFLEHVYRRIEYWIEGDRNQQIKLSNGPLNFEKIWKKGLKNTVFYLIAFAVSNVFLQYLVGTDHWLELVELGPQAHVGTFSALLIFSVVFYFVFAWFREQACIVVCPYGRLQGVLLDRNSLVILYDWIRGEPRGKGKRQENDGKGDCIDCGLCVQVCPTGIDIRNGTQLECVNCTACIDVCDSVMNKVGKEPGLIRFDSVNGVEQGNRKVMTPRAWAYSAILFILSGVVILLLATRSQVETVFLRMEGQIYQKDGTKIVNIYDYTLINKSDEAMQLRFEPIDQSAELILIGEDVIVLDPEEIRHGSAMLKIEREELTASKIKVKLLVLDENGNEIDQISTNFLGPLVRK